MNEMTLDTLMQRLDHVERENRRLKRVGSMLLISIVSIVLMGQATGSKVVEAEKFILRDSDGNERGWLTVRKGVGPILALLDDSGRERVMLGVGRDLAGQKPFLALFDAHGKERAGLAVGDEGSKMVLLDSQGDAEARLAVGEETEEYRKLLKRPEQHPKIPRVPYLSISKDRFKHNLSLGSDHLIFDSRDNHGNKESFVVLSEAALAFFEANEKTRLLLTGTQGQKTGFALFDKEGNTRAELLLDPEKGYPRLNLADHNGKIRAAIVVTPEGSPFLTIMNAKEKIIWKAP